MAKFLSEQRSIQSITMKYWTASHMCVQEVDSIYSNMKKVISVSECLSPVSFHCKSQTEEVQAFCVWLKVKTF